MAHAMSSSHDDEGTWRTASTTDWHRERGPPLMSTRLPAGVATRLPVGATATRRGSDGRLRCGDVVDAVSAQRWIADHLCRLVVPVLRRRFMPLAIVPGWCDAATVVRLNAEFRASRESAEPRAETAQVGFPVPPGAAKWRRSQRQGKRNAGFNRFGHCAGRGSLAAVASGLNVADGLTGYLFGFAENQVMVLAKALPMGQIAAQKLLFALATPGGAVDRPQCSKR